MSTPARVPGAPAPPARASFASIPVLRPGALIHYGKYRIGEVLGRGSFAVVYAAEHVALRRPVAIKVVHVTPETSRGLITRFQREAQTSALVRHPNVLETHDSGTLGDGSPFLVIERVEGTTLAAALTQGPLDIATAVDLGRQLARGLVAIGEAGIVHRDLKPENVMLHSRRDGTLQVKIVDFGVSKRVASQAVGLTAQGELIGTPQYTAPEQLRGEDIDVRADIYALGALLYEVLTGRAPHERENLGDLMVAVLNEPLRRPRELRSDCPPALEDVLLRALERARERRFESPAAMLAALERVAPQEIEPPASPLQSAAVAGHPPPSGAARTAASEPPPSPAAQRMDAAGRSPAPPPPAPPPHAPHPRLQRRAQRALALGAAGAAGVLALVFSLVAPHAQDQTQPPSEASQRARPKLPAAAGTSAAAASAAAASARPALPPKVTDDAPADAKTASTDATNLRAAKEPRVGREAASPPHPPTRPGKPATADEVATRTVAAARGSQRGAPGEPTASADAELDESADRTAADRGPAPASQPPAASSAEHVEKPSLAQPAGPDSAPEVATPSAIARWDATMRRALGALVRGDAAAARGHYRLATELLPARAAGYRGLALSAARAGERAEAERALARYRELSSDAAGASSIAARIAAIASP